MPKPEFESLKGLLLEMARERSADALFQPIVRRLAARPHVAMVRIWLVGPGVAVQTASRAAGRGIWGVGEEAPRQRDMRIVAHDILTLAKIRLRQLLYGTAVPWIIGLATFAVKRM